jgi:hypothetical protein
MDTPRQQTSVNDSEPPRTALESRSGQKVRRATGPRTAAGKRRSRLNSMKAGVFAKDLLLKNESRSDFDLMLRGYHELFAPQGMAETELVESLAWNRWRKRRLFHAEKALVQEAAGFKIYDSIAAQVVEVWDRSRAGETSGGMLRRDSNPYVMREAITMLTMFRAGFEKRGFRQDDDAWMLVKLYGLDHNNEPPFGLLRTFRAYSKLATGAIEGVEPAHSADELKEKMLESIDAEIKRLEILEQIISAADSQRGEYQTIAALIPPQGDLDRIIRYEAHLSREYDRILSQLEHLQRIRLGQPTPPTIRLEI